jgi:hypothetical protein
MIAALEIRALQEIGHAEGMPYFYGSYPFARPTPSSASTGTDFMKVAIGLFCAELSCGTVSRKVDEG